MSRSIKLLLVLFLCLAVSACGATAPAAAPATEAPAAVEEAPAGAPILSVSGMVGQELALTEADLQGMQVVTLTAEHPKNGPTEYTGVYLNAVLDMAGIADAAGKLVITASDGYSAEVPLADVKACTECLIAMDGSALNMVMPGMSSKAWVKEVVKIELAGG